ncbi:MAG TPA: hypothetical protein VMF50_05150 [Candidatus Binataceae bacterium]|nr:hypothetical protein [Candidatus Binataceae bacterium]
MTSQILDDGQVTAAINLLGNRGDVATLLEIIAIRKTPALAENRDYQRTFTGYYRMGRKKQSFYQAYYSMLQNAARADSLPSLSAVLQNLFDQTREKHLSFSSKLCATLDDNAVIFDKNVAGFFGVPRGDLGQQNWLTKALDRYRRVQQGIDSFTHQPAWPQMRAQFNEKFPNAIHLPDIRVADLIIWADGAA